jgi:hypothetical protein
MGRYFKSKNGKYQRWSSNTDKKVGKDMTVEEMRADLALDGIYDAATRLMDHELRFPNGRGFDIDDKMSDQSEYEKFYHLEYQELFDEFNKRVKATGAIWVPQINLVKNDQAKKEAGGSSEGNKEG